MVQLTLLPANEQPDASDDAPPAARLMPFMVTAESGRVDVPVKVMVPGFGTVLLRKSGETTMLVSARLAAVPSTVILLVETMGVPAIWFPARSTASAPPEITNFQSSLVETFLK